MTSTTTTQPIRVLIADDHRLFRRGLRQICENLGGFSVVAKLPTARKPLIWLANCSRT